MKKYILNSGFLIILVGITISGCTRSSNDFVTKKDSQIIKESYSEKENNFLENTIAGKAYTETTTEESKNKPLVKIKTKNKPDVKKDDVTEKTEEPPVIYRKQRDPRVADDSDMQRGSFDFREYKKRMGYEDKTQIDEYVDESKLKKSE